MDDEFRVSVSDVAGSDEVTIMVFLRDEVGESQLAIPAIAARSGLTGAGPDRQRRTVAVLRRMLERADSPSNAAAFGPP